MDVCHRFAGVVACTQADVLLPHLVSPPFLGFITESDVPQVRCSIRRIPTERDVCPPLSGWQRDAILRVEGFPEQWLKKPALQVPAVRRQLDRCLGEPEFLRLELRWGRAILFDHARSELHYFYPESLLPRIAGPEMVASYRNLMAPFWPRFSAVMVHAAGLIRRGMAAIFLAPDEGGKSTLVGLCSERGGVLSDDHVVLRAEAGRVRAHGSPCGKVTDGELSADLGAIFILEKAREFSICSIEADEVLSYLMDQHSRLFLSLPKNGRVKAFEVLAGACAQAGTFRLRFPRSFIDWQAVDGAIEAAREASPFSISA